MSISQQLEQKQSQTLVMTPQLQQAIKILELSNLELASYLETEILTNPLLTFNEHDVDAEDIKPEEDQGEAEDFDDIWSEESMSDRISPTRKEALPGRENSLDRIEALPASLREHLLSQLATDVADPVDKLIGSFLIRILEDTGYFPLKYMEQARNLGTTPDRIEKTIQLLQQFDPPGVFARSLAECLRLQLQDRGVLTKQILQVLDHLDLFEQGEIDKILKLCQITKDELREIMTEIRLCDPKPGLKFASYESGHVIPDVILEGNQGLGWHLKLNDQTLPKVLVDEAYYKDLKKAKCQSNYVSEKYTAANGLLKAINQRALTIMAVTQQILMVQSEFFDKGIHYLKPMTLADIASVTGLHESTISRVTTNKYIQTPRGTFELKFFFTSSIYSLHQEDEMSSSSVRERIKEIIQKEDHVKPLSDDQLVKVLNAEGVLVARRTITKYRESLDIPSSFERKRRYACQL
jgi:RNA polymerase sigma-54 factor